MKQTNENETLVISAPNISIATFRIVGTAPYVQLRFSQKRKILDGMAEEKTTAKKKKREPRNYAKEFEEAQHISDEGWNGIPASSFRNGMISACRLVGFKMTLAKLSVFVEADGFDRDDLMPLVRIEGNPAMLQSHVRNATGVIDIRTRAQFWPWAAMVRVRYDGDQFKAADVANLLMRVGAQVGVGEGRPDGRDGAGMGWGLFNIEG